MQSGWARASGTLLVGSCVALSMVGCSDAPRANRNVSESSNLIEIRLVKEESDSALMPVEFEGAVIYLHPEPLLSDEDLARVEPFVRPGQLILRLELTSAAGERMFSRTSAEVGNYLALIVDGEVRSAPVIRDAVRGPAEMVIPVSAEEAARLSELVRARWP